MFLTGAAPTYAGAPYVKTGSSPIDFNWPHWRGPTRDGHSTDRRAPLEWDSTKNLKWQVELPGAGNSSPIVWGNRIFLTSATHDGSERWIICIDRLTGKVLWQRKSANGLPPEPTHAWNTHASATCATDGERVYAFFGTPGLYCYDLAGNLLWRREFGVLGSSTGWAAGAASPTLVDDLVIVNGDQGALRGQVDGKGTDYGPSWLWALDKRTGEVVWRVLRNQGEGWCTPIVWTEGGRRQLVLNGQLAVCAYDPTTGKELWRVTGREESEGFGEVTPVWGHGLVYVFTGKPGPAWAIRSGGSGDISKTHLAWHIKRKDRDVSSPILVGNHLYTISRIGIATCLDAKTGKELGRARLGGQPCASLVCVRGKIVFLSEDGAASVVEPGPEMTVLYRNKLGDGDEFRASPAVIDGQWLIRSNRRLYCIAAADEIRELKGHTSSVMTLAFSPDGKSLASGSRDRTVRLWNVATGKPERTLEGHGADVYSAIYSDDSKHLVTSSGDKTIRVWNANTGALRQTLTGHTDVVRAVALSRDGKLLASGGMDKTIRIWDTATWEPKATLQSHTLRGLAFSPDGKTLASGGTDQTVLLWDVPNHTLRAMLKGHAGSIEAVAFAPGGKIVASSSSDSTILLWDAERSVLLRTLKGHTGEIDSIAFAPDGKILASGSKDKTLKLWNPTTGELLRTVTGSTTRLESLAFSRDGKLLASGSGGPEALVRLYRLAELQD